MMLGGIISLFSLFFSGTAAVVIFLTAIIVASIIPVLYSYLLHARNKAK